MKTLTKAQYEYLNKFDDRFRCATRSNYCRNIQTKDVLRMKAIYEELIGIPYIMSINCSSCILKLVQKLSEPYFKYQDKLNARKER